MARKAQDREDLLRDATAFPVRMQLRMTALGKSIVVFAGFRANGAASIYFDQDPVYHFNSSRQLRRAYVAGRLVKAEQGRLVALKRQDDENEVALVRKKLKIDEQQLFCDSASQQLAALKQEILAGRFEIEGQVPPENEISAVDQLVAFLGDLHEIQVADTPRVIG